MNKLSLTLFAALCAGVLFVGAPQDADAGHPFARGRGLGGGRLGVGFGGGYGCGDGLSLYRNGQIPVPPYFALHPPVYYSAPVARTYGYSPFPYPGDVRTPDVLPLGASAKMITNPYAQPVKQAEDKAEKPKEDSVAEVAPLVIRNPFVDGSRFENNVHVAKTIEN